MKLMGTFSGEIIPIGLLVPIICENIYGGGSIAFVWEVYSTVGVVFFSDGEEYGDNVGKSTIF